MRVRVVLAVGFWILVLQQFQVLDQGFGQLHPVRERQFIIQVTTAPAQRLLFRLWGFTPSNGRKPMEFVRTLIRLLSSLSACQWLASLAWEGLTVLAIQPLFP